MAHVPNANSAATANSVVLVQRLADHIALVTLNRPQARNAVNGAVAQALQAAVDETEADPGVWVVVLTGAGPDVFCAGADLKEVSAGRSALLRTERSGFAGFVYGARSKPWIAAVNGKALAGGVFRLPRALPPKIAIELILTAGQIDAQRANDLTEQELRAMVDEAMPRLTASADYKEGPLAFIEKREPRWTGR